MSEREAGSCRSRVIHSARRHFLRLGLLSGVSLLTVPVLASRHPVRERALSLSSTHTGESVVAVYWADGEYLDTGLDSINSVLRDHRSGEVYPIDTDLLDLLYVLHAGTGSRKAFEVISGYRSPASNAALRAASAGVARKSYHIQGKAIDIRLPGCELSALHRAALALSAGGVGYYPASGFIHVDVGPVRSW